MLHEYRTRDAHKRMFDHLKRLIPELSEPDVNSIIVTDEETSIVESVKSAFPNLKRFRCHIHAWKNIKLKLAKLGISKKETVKNYKSDFYRLLNQCSYVEYLKLLPQLVAKWNNTVAKTSIYLLSA